MKDHLSDIPEGQYAVVEPIESGPQRLYTAILWSTHESHQAAWAEWKRRGSAGRCVVQHVEDYVRIPSVDLPSDIRWDTSRADQGQIVEHSYASPGSASEAGEGDPYYRILDHSTGNAEYYHLQHHLVAVESGFGSNEYATH